MDLLANGLTEELALAITHGLWRWLERNPGAEKENWPGWATGIVPAMLYHCPCCEFVDKKLGSFHHPGSAECDSCPLSCLWGNDCTGDATPYRKWAEAMSGLYRDQREGAVQILASEAARAARCIADVAYNRLMWLRKREES